MTSWRLVPSAVSGFVTTAVMTAAVLALGAAPAHGQDRLLRLTWVDRTGQAIGTVGPPGSYRGPDLSLDGKRLAAHRHEGNGGDIWLDDGKGGLTRLTTDTTGTQENASPIFSPDGTRVAFSSFRNGQWGLYVKRADGRGDEQRLIESGSRKMPMSWSPDGQFIVYWVNGGSQWVIPVTGQPEPRRLHDAPNSHAQISPDGKWVSFNSQGQIHVKSFPAGDESRQVSTNGGVFARWRGDSKELYFLSTGFLGEMMAVEIGVIGSSLQPGTPRSLFASGYVNMNHLGGNYHTYSVTPDGQRFLIPRPEPGTLTMFDRRGQVTKILGRDLGAPPMFSPDGLRAAFVRNANEIWVVDVGTGQETRVASHRVSDRVQSLVWSPDGRQLVYLIRELERELLYRVASSGQGQTEVLYRLPGFNTALTDWSPDGRFVIYYTSQLAGNRLFALPVTGEPKPVEIMRSDMPILGARLSPDGRYLAYQSLESLGSERQLIWVRPFDFGAGGAGKTTWQVAEASRAMSVGIWWKADGRELYFLGPKRSVMAVEVRGASPTEFGKPQLLFTAPESIPDGGGPDVWGSVSRNGDRVLFSIAPMEPPPPDRLAQLTLFDRQGKVVTRVGPPGRYGQAALSPDGTRIAVRSFGAPPIGRSDIWAFDIATGKGIAITDDAAPDLNPLWSPDGTQILYVSQRPGGYAGIYRKAANGSGKEELLYRHTPGTPVLLRDITPDGKYLTFGSGGVVLVVPLTGTDPAARQAVELSREEFFLQPAWFSPDGRFVGFGSNESGGFEIYVRPFDAASGTAAGDEKWRVSRDGGVAMVAWRADGREMYFLDAEPDLVVMAVDVSTTPATGFQPSTPKVLFHVPGDALGDLGATKYISRDGQRFVFILPVAAAAAPTR